MKSKKTFLTIISILMALLIPIILYLSLFNSVAFDIDFYKKEFSKYDVYSNLNDYVIEEINYDVLDYLKYSKGNEMLGNGFFNEREELHLFDVKRLIQKAFLTFYFSLISFLFLFFIIIVLMDFNMEKIMERLLLIIFFGSLLTLLTGFLFFAMSYLNFDFIFDKFHETLFPVGTYIFNPEFEKIVVLYPGGLFFDALINIVVRVIFSSVILIAASSAVLITFYKGNFLKIFFIKSRR